MLFDWEAMVASGFTQTIPLYTKFDFVDWIWDVCIMEPKGEQLAIGTAHNTVVLWSTVSSKPLRIVCGKQRCILYSMSLLPVEDDLLVASGTVFTEVHIWRLSDPSHPFVCKGHKGVIFKVRWNTDGRYLLSVSDDRTVIVWRNASSSLSWWESRPTSSSHLLSSPYTLLFRGYGHTARIWDCAFTPREILTVSEDCSLRVWSPAGTCLASLPAHSGKHIWSVAYAVANDVAITAGNDGAVRMWPITAILDSLRPLTATVPSEEIPAGPHCSKSEAIRELLRLENSRLLLATNWGYLWSLEFPANWKALRIPAEHEGVTAAALSDDTRTLVLGDPHGRIRVIDVPRGTEIAQICEDSLRVAKLVYFDTAPNACFAAVFADNRVKLFLMEKNHCTCMLNLPPAGKGTVTTVLYVPEKALFCVGDSVGILHLYQLTPAGGVSLSVKNQRSLHLHAHQPIGWTGYVDGQFVTTGHDGQLRRFSVDPMTLGPSDMEMMSIPGLRQIVSCCVYHNRCILAGFQESWLRLYDLTHECEIMSIPAGGWKRPLILSSPAGDDDQSVSVGFVTSSGWRDVSVARRECGLPRGCVSEMAGTTHGRELNAIAWLAGNVVTGGEDRVLKIAAKEEGKPWKPWKTREGHSSCVRGLLAVSSTETPLLISCGGRNEVFFWTVSPRGDITFLWGSPRGKKESEDQRVMCVAANGAGNTLLVAAGDSRGKLRFFTVEGTRVKVAGEVTGHVTPILAIAMTRDGIVIAGTAAGDLVFLRCEKTESAGINMGEVIVDPAVHVMGINGVAIQETEDAIRCFTVGDDQSFRISMYDRATLKCVHREVHERVSGTALRSVRVGKSGVYFSGWEQQIQHWVERDGAFEKVESFYSIVPEIACIDVREDANRASICACGAMGFEVLELSV